MPKAILIIFLGLLLSGCETIQGGAGNVSYKDENRIVLGFTDALIVGIDAMSNGTHINNKIAVDHCKSHGKFAFYHYGGMDKPGGAGEFICSKKYLAQHPVTGGELDWTNFDKSSEIYSEVNEESEKVKLASMINEAKSTCKELGFTEGTEKFSDCALKLYSQSVELAAKNNQTVVMQPQSSGSNSVTIYDPVRDSNALIKKGQRMISGACTLGIDC